jgi:hypothetical protein
VPIDHAVLRRAVLAASLLDDIPLTPDDHGVRLGPTWEDRTAWISAGWAELHAGLAGAEPLSDPGRLRLRDWLRARTASDHSALRRRAVVRALPVGHALHPGPSWVQESVLGGVLDLGIGLRTESPTPGAGPALGVPLPTTAYLADTSVWWPALVSHRNEMAALALDRLHRDGNGTLRPVGDCDVLTLLSSPTLRCYLAAEDGTGMRAVAVPMRERGWCDVSRIDPVFVGAAASATSPEHRGVSRPLLVTVDEVGQVPQVTALAAQARIALADRTISLNQLNRPVLYR